MDVCDPLSDVVGWSRERLRVPKERTTCFFTIIYTQLYYSDLYLRL